MAKAQKPPPRPPAPELTEKDRAHLNWIRQNSTNLVRTALKLYQKSGRGAFIVREQDAKPSRTFARYFPAMSVLGAGVGWPDVRTAELVRTYQPTQQFVIVFAYLDGAISVYTIRFVQTGDTFAVEAV
jgi:hypothetical protein